MNAWEIWKKWFYKWEAATADVLEQWLKSPAVLKPSGSILSAAMNAKALSDRAMASWWTVCGLPTKRDQERALHSLNQLQSRLMDIEEKLAVLEPKNSE